MSLDATTNWGVHFDAHQVWTVAWMVGALMLGLSVLVTAVFLLGRLSDWRTTQRRIADGTCTLSDVWRYLDDKIDQTGNPQRDQFDPVRDAWMYHEPRLVLAWAQSGQPLRLLHVYIQAGFTTPAIYAHIHGDAPISVDTAQVMAALRNPTTPVTT